MTEENLQARIRGNLVMALSNKFGWLVLTTGNKSELSVGYATLYGDMAGGFAVLKDVFKGWVYRLVEWRNQQAGRELVPAAVITRPPSAELRHDQRDDQSLPPYDVLDAILAGYVEEDLDAAAAGGPGVLRGRCRANDRPGRPRRVQAPPGAARASGSPPAPSAATGACRSPAATARRWASRSGACALWAEAAQGRQGAGRTAIVTRVAAQRRPWSSVKSTSHTQLVRPRWMQRASALTVPSDTGRRKLVKLDWPMATSPSSRTAW